MSSSPIARAPKLQLAFKQPSIGGCWNPPKTKKKPQQDGRRGTIMIKSKSIPARWMTYKLEYNNTKEALPVLLRF